jgi:hypothetical protein
MDNLIGMRMRRSERGQTKQSVQEGFDRLQRLLFDMLPGDDFRPKDAARICELSEDICRTVFEGLERAGMMTHERGDRFVRKTLDLQAAQAMGLCS